MCVCVCVAGLSNIIGIIVYISAAAGDPSQSESKRSHWYGWSFYCGASSFIATETVGVLAVHLFIDAHRRLRAANPSRRTHTHTRTRSHSLTRSRRSSSYRSRYRRRPSRMSETRLTPPSLWRPALAADLLPLTLMYTPQLPHTHSPYPSMRKRRIIFTLKYSCGVSERLCDVSGATEIEVWMRNGGGRGRGRNSGEGQRGGVCMCVWEALMG